jgi:hypothetical protein
MPLTPHHTTPGYSPARLDTGPPPAHVGSRHCLTCLAVVDDQPRPHEVVETEVERHQA